MTDEGVVQKQLRLPDPERAARSYHAWKGAPAHPGVDEGSSFPFPHIYITYIIDITVILVIYTIYIIDIIVIFVISVIFVIDLINLF